jgi:hypothetical protein
MSLAEEFVKKALDLVLQIGSKAGFATDGSTRNAPTWSVANWTANAWRRYKRLLKPAQ